MYNNTCVAWMLQHTKWGHVYILYITSKYYIRPFQLQARLLAKVDNDLEDILWVLGIGGNEMC